MDIKREVIKSQELLKRYAAGDRNFAGIRFREMSLREVDLREIDLSWSEFIGVDLSGTNLSHANLIGVKLLCVNLSKANLSYANLRWADLTGADCIGTDFSNANLSDAILTAVKFDGADLYRTAIGGDAILIVTDFRGAKNFPPIGQGTLVCKAFWDDGSFFKGPEWVE